MLSQVHGVDEAEAVAERICAALRLPMAVAGRQVAVDASIGVALGAPGQTDPAALMRAADIAMYHAKRAGRGRHEVYAEAMALAFGPTAAA
jgi:diguanylate cyclase (GGDEF)-like protein